MKNKRLISIFGIVLIILILFFTYGTPGYRSMKVKYKDFSGLESKLKDAVNAKAEIDMKELTDFDWDECYVFTPYYPATQVYEKTGTEWTAYRTFIGYLIFHKSENETVNDDQYLIVFKKDSRVVLSAIYSTNRLPVIFNLGNNFKFTSDKAKFTVTASKQYSEGKIKELVAEN